MPDPVMPFGVEHKYRFTAPAASAPVPDPVMPFGVEHIAGKLKGPQDRKACPTP